METTTRSDTDRTPSDAGGSLGTGAAMDAMRPSNVWMLADWSDSDYNVNPYLPLADTQRAAPLLALMARIAAWLTHRDTTGEN